MNGILLVGSRQILDKYFQHFDKIFPGRNLRILSEMEYHQLEMVKEKLLLWDYSAKGLNFSEGSAVILLVDFPALSGDEQSELKELCLSNSSIKGWIDISRPLEFYYAQLAQLIDDRLGMLESSLNKLVTHTMSELQRLKTIHEKLVPIRHEKFKGLQLHSKYISGESSGGDFFEILSKKNELVFLLTSSSSYLANSVIGADFEWLRGRKSFDDEAMRKFIIHISTQLKDLKIEDLHLLLVKIDLNKMCLTGYKLGAIEHFSNKKIFGAGNQFPVSHEFLDRAYLEFKLEREERIVFVSAGVLSNSRELSHELELPCFFQQHFDKAPISLLNELFYQLKKESNSYFLKHDGTAIYIEVDKNAFIQV